MALTLRTISNSGAGLKDPAGNLLTNIEVSFTLCDRYGKAHDFFDSVSGERIASVLQEVVTDSNAEFSVQLWPTSRATETAFYKCSVNHIGIKDFIAPLVEGADALSWATFKASGATLASNETSGFAQHVQDMSLHLTSAQNSALDAANNPSLANPLATLNDIVLSGGGHVIQDEGVSAPAQGKLNFTGAGVQVSDDPTNGATVVTIVTGETSAATNMVAGAVKLSTAASDPTNPIAVGDNDSRLGDARTPLSHTQKLSTIDDVTISVTNLNALDDGVNTTLHFHNTDRDRANHSGTQAWNTVSKTGSVLTDIADVPTPVASKALKRNATNTGYEWADISGLTDHEGLTGLSGGAANDHHHITGTQRTDLTDGGDSTLHYHAADRNVDNHVAGTTNKLFTATEKTKLAGVSDGANNYTHPATHSADIITDGTVNKAFTSTEKTKLSGIAESANNYSHPSTHSADIITDGTNNKAFTAAEKTKLAGIASSANNYTHPETHSADIITDGTTNKAYTATEKTKLAGIEASANNYTHPSTHEASIISVTTSGFAGNLTASEDTVQKALDKIDDLALGAGSGTSISKEITQASHGLFIGNLVRHDGLGYVKSLADVADTADVIGIVSSVADIDTFTLTVAGYVDGLVGLAPGTVFYLSESTAGTLTPVEPSAVGNVSKPVFFADSISSGYLINLRGVEIVSAVSGSLVIPDEDTGVSTTYTLIVGLDEEGNKILKIVEL